MTPEVNLARGFMPPHTHFLNSCIFQSTVSEINSMLPYRRCGGLQEVWWSWRRCGGLGGGLVVLTGGVVVLEEVWWSLRRCGGLSGGVVVLIGDVVVLG